jgi:hypothetical protein
VLLVGLTSSTVDLYEKWLVKLRVRSLVAAKSLWCTALARAVESVSDAKPRRESDMVDWPEWTDTPEHVYIPVHVT